MTWLDPGDDDRQLLQQVRECEPNHYALACVVAPALRIEPLLLRSARLRFVPNSGADLEAEFWFGSLIDSQSATAVTLRPGVARLLTDQLLADGDQFAQTLLPFLREHTRHWHALDRIEQQLRLDVVMGDAPAVQAGLRRALQLLHAADEDERRTDIARWARSALPGLTEERTELDEFGWLALFASARLDDAGGLLTARNASPMHLPDWLAPELRSMAASGARLGLVWWPGVLQCLPTGEGDHDLPLPTAPPAPVRIVAEGAATEFDQWHALSPGARISVPADAEHLVLQTLLGERYRLSKLTETEEATVEAAAEAATAGPAPIRRRRALVLGIDHYAGLPGPDANSTVVADANTVAERLEALGYETIRLIGEGAIMERLENALNSVLNESGEGDLVWLHVSAQTLLGRSSHEDLLLPLYDTNPRDQSDTSVSMDELMNRIRSAGATATLVTLEHRDLQPFRGGQPEALEAPASAHPDQSVAMLVSTTLGGVWNDHGPLAYLILRALDGELESERPGITLVEFADQVEMLWHRWAADNDYDEQNLYVTRTGPLTSTLIPEDALDRLGAERLEVLSRGSTLTCDHGGKLVFSAEESDQPLSENDLLNATIVGCPNSGFTMKPCTRVVSIESGLSDQRDPEGNRWVFPSVGGKTDGTPPGGVSFGAKVARLVRVTEIDRSAAQHIRVLFAPGDETTAAALAELFRANGLEAEPLAYAEALEMATVLGTEVSPDQEPMVGLWNANTQRTLERSTIGGALPITRGLIVRSDETPVPEDTGALQTLDIRKWDRDPAGELSAQVVKAARQLLASSASETPKERKSASRGAEVFVLHTQEGDRAAASIRNQVWDARIRVTGIPEWSSDVYHDWSDQRADAVQRIELASVVVAVITRDFERDGFVIELLNIAIEHDKRIIPVLTDDVHTAPESLGNLQSFTLDGRDPGQIDYLVNEIQAALAEARDQGEEWTKEQQTTEFRQQTIDLETINLKTGEPSPYRARDSLPPGKNYRPGTVKLLQELDDPDTLPKRRLEIGDELARIGDPRRGVGLRSDGLPDIDWVEIPAGEFLYGEDKETRFEDTFWIARYPVTNAQYQAFIDDGGYRDKRWWEGLAEKSDKPKRSRFSPANRPRTDVSWYEAIAYCRWLAAHIDYRVTLPTETQWEKAATGIDGREYPWGDGYKVGFANVNETTKRVGPNYLQQTTAAGVYPQSASPYLLLDLAGNVWEWCLNEFYNPKNTATSDSKERVLRGGSWDHHPDDARSALRGQFEPGPRQASVGFRLCYLSPNGSSPSGSKETHVNRDGLRAEK